MLWVWRCHFLTGLSDVVEISLKYAYTPRRGLTPHACKEQSLLLSPNKRCRTTMRFWSMGYRCRSLHRPRGSTPPARTKTSPPSATACSGCGSCNGHEKSDTWHEVPCTTFEPQQTKKRHGTEEQIVAYWRYPSPLNPFGQARYI